MEENTLPLEKFEIKTHICEKSGFILIFKTEEKYKDCDELKDAFYYFPFIRFRNVASPDLIEYMVCIEMLDVCCKNSLFDVTVEDLGSLATKIRSAIEYEKEENPWLFR